MTETRPSVTSDPAGGPALRASDRAVVQHELGEAEALLTTTERRRDRHLVWSALGVSPALLVPIALGWSMDGVGALSLIAAAVAMTGYEAFRAIREQRKLPELRRIVSERRAELDNDPAAP